MELEEWLPEAGGLRNYWEAGKGLQTSGSENE